MDRARRIIDTIVGVALAGLMGLLVVNVTWQVISRYVLRSPSSYSEELARYGLVWAGLLGAACASGRGMHLAIDLLPRALGGKGTARLRTITALCVLTFALAVMVWGGGRLVWMTLFLGQKSAAMRIPLGWVYMALPVSGGLMAFYAVCELRGAGDRARPDEPDGQHGASGG